MKPSDMWTPAMHELRERFRPKTLEEAQQWAEAERQDRQDRQREWKEHVRRQRAVQSRQRDQERKERGQGDSYY
jgi:hypothetical protein